MFHGDTIRALETWKRSGRRSVPVLSGPYGIGKSTVAESFGSSYSRCLRLSFGSDPGLRCFLRECSDETDLVRRLEERFGRGSVIPGDTVVIADEICMVPWGMGSLSRLHTRDSVDIVATASGAPGDLADIDTDSSAGLERIRMRPVGFRGFLHAMSVDGNVIDSVTECLGENADVPRREDRLMHSMISKYAVTGGMPRAVTSMADSGRLRDVLDVSRSNVRGQLSCARRLLPSTHDIVRSCLASIPAQLADNGRFTFARIPGHPPRRCQEGLGWLEASGMVDICRRAGDTSRTDSHGSEQESFKAYCDCGTMACLMQEWAADAAMNGNFGSCPTAVMENCTASFLAGAGRPLMYYRRNRKEADFLVPHGREVSGVSVRPFSNGRRKSLSFLLDEGIVTRTVEFGGSGRSGCEERYPLYAVGFPDTLFPD